MRQTSIPNVPERFGGAKDEEKVMERLRKSGYWWRK